MAERQEDCLIPDVVEPSEALRAAGFRVGDWKLDRFRLQFWKSSGGLGFQVSPLSALRASGL